MDCSSLLVTILIHTTLVHKRNLLLVMFIDWINTLGVTKMWEV